MSKKRFIINTLCKIWELLEYGDIELRDDSIFDFDITNDMRRSYQSSSIDMKNPSGSQMVRINAVLRLESKEDK